MDINSRFLRASFATGWLYFFLLWLYIATRLITDPDLMFEPFINVIPWLDFWVCGMISFLLSAFCMLIYLTFWGFSKGDTWEKGV